MLILGINDAHDASACLVRDGELLVAISEERLQRVKGMGGFPLRALQACLDVAGVELTDIDRVAMASEKLVPNNFHNVGATFSVRDYLDWEERYYRPILYDQQQPKMTDIFPEYRPSGELVYPIERIPFATTSEPAGRDLDGFQRIRLEFLHEFFGNTDSRRIGFYRHHRCHAFYGYYTNPERWDDATIVTSDAGGDGAYSSIHVVRDGRFSQIHEARTNLLGKIYSAVTLALSMRPNEHEYKVMGLAPYTNEYHRAGPRQLFLDALSVDGLDFVRNAEMKDYFHYFKERLHPYRFDGIAGGVQDFTEIRLAEWFRNIVGETGIGKIAYSGGVANNVKANKGLVGLDCVESLFVPAGPGDESLSIGAAYCALYDEAGAGVAREQIAAPQNAYWGNCVDSNDHARFRAHPFVQEHYAVVEDCQPERLADLIASGEVVALCFGSMEFGSRALGHRSLVTDPSRPDSARRINDLIKKRDFWMPFAPSILAECGADYVVNPKGLDSPYMTLSFDTTPLGRDHLRAAVHPYDHTVRPQFVHAGTCPRYHALLQAFRTKTGVGALLNTSLNIHGKPIVMNPTDLLEEILLQGDIPLNCILIDNTFYVRRVQVEDPS